MFPEPLSEASQQDLISAYLYKNRTATPTNNESKNERINYGSSASDKDENHNKETNYKNPTAVTSKEKPQNKPMNYRNSVAVPRKNEHQNKGRNDKNTTVAPSKAMSQNKGGNARSFFADLASPNYQDYRAMIADDHSLNQRTFPREDICQYYGLRKPITAHDKVKDNHPLPACRPIAETEEDCKETIEYYGKPGVILPTKCEENMNEPVCTIKQYNPNESKEANKIHMTCNIKQCQINTLFVGFLNDDTGLTGEKDWIQVTNNSHLRQTILRHMHKSQFGSGYALIKCKNLRSDKVIMQTLFLPRIVPVKERKTSRSKKRININIILEDSLSRKHFFRSLPKTKATLRNILHSSSSKATVLDFEMMQGFSSFTWGNLIRLFAAGKGKYKKTGGQEVLYQMFKNAGYATFYQQDSCWYDRWGTDLIKDMVTYVNRGEKEMLKKWIKHKEYFKKANFTNFIDDFGLTYYTCTAFKDMNVSNMYRSPTTCYNSEYLSSMYFRYTRNYIDALQRLSSTTPFFAYTHMLTSHESSGKRIASDDEGLSELLNHAAQQHNTLTILLSDHGGKITPFSIKTKQGRYEVFQPLMFMIVPDNVAKVLGKNVMDALVVNQKRLVTSEDLHFALRSLVQNVQNEEKNISNGLFTPIPLKRTCNDIQFYDNEALCRCDGWTKAVSSTSIQTQWAAEVALGYINNKIQNERMNTTKQRSHETSSQRCQRYSGKRVEHARVSSTTRDHVLSFGLVVKPLFMDVEERFEIDVAYPVGWIDGSRVTNFVRVSRYDTYEHCREPTVHDTICTCKEEATLRHNDVIQKAQHESEITRKSESKMLDEPCLGLIRRSRQRLVLNTIWQDALVTYEAFNNCSNFVYKLFVECEKRFLTRLSTSMPLSVELLPNTLTHLVTETNFWKSGIFIPRIKFKRTKV